LDGGLEIIHEEIWLRSLFIEIPDLKINWGELLEPYYNLIRLVKLIYMNVFVL